MLFEVVFHIFSPFVRGWVFSFCWMFLRILGGLGDLGDLGGLPLTAL